MSQTANNTTETFTPAKVCYMLGIKRSEFDLLVKLDLLVLTDYRPGAPQRVANSSIEAYLCYLIDNRQMKSNL